MALKWAAKRPRGNFSVKTFCSRDLPRNDQRVVGGILMCLCWGTRTAPPTLTPLSDPPRLGLGVWVCTLPSPLWCIAPHGVPRQPGHILPVGAHPPGGAPAFHGGAGGAGVSLTGKKKKKKECSGFPKKPAGTPCAQPWLVAVGGWRLAAVGGWQLATGGWWRLVVVGGGWWLTVGGWRQLAVVGSWRLVAASGWRRLVAGGWWRLVVGGWWRLAVDGSWRLAVPWGGP